MDHIGQLTRTLGGNVLEEWEGLQAVGASRGILVGWNRRRVGKEARIESINVVHLVMSDVRSGYRWLFLGACSLYDFTDK